MIFYIIGILFFVVVIIICTILLHYYLKDEKELVEVTDEQLSKMGKTYSKLDFEMRMFDQYVRIISSVAYEDYQFLKDSVSDTIYNQILIDAKRKNDQRKVSVVTDVKKEFCKLISFGTIKDLEVAKLWVRYSSIEYAQAPRKSLDENGQEIIVNAVVEGDKEKTLTHEYILTFVKNKSETENIVCPNCGFQYDILTSSNCVSCESEVVPKRLHWVYVNKITTNMSSKKY